MRAILYVARALRLKTVAEGIEGLEDVRELRGLFCDYGKGHYFSEPVDAPLVPRLVATQWPIAATDSSPIPIAAFRAR